jgi:hypothetical protein
MCSRVRIRLCSSEYGFKDVRRLCPKSMIYAQGCDVFKGAHKVVLRVSMGSRMCVGCALSQ